MTDVLEVFEPDLIVSQKRRSAHHRYGRLREQKDHTCSAVQWSSTEHVVRDLAQSVLEFNEKRLFV